VHLNNAGVGINAAPALFRCTTRAQAGVSRRTWRRTEREIVVILTIKMHDVGYARTV